MVLILLQSYNHFVPLVSIHGHLETGSDTPGEIELAATFNDSEEEGQVTVTRKEGEKFFGAGNGHYMKENI